MAQVVKEGNRPFRIIAYSQHWFVPQQRMLFLWFRIGPKHGFSTIEKAASVMTHKHKLISYGLIPFERDES